MARPRKLFPIYGSTLANHMVTALARERIVGQFVADYVDAYDRDGILGESARDREFAETIGREVLLAWIVEVQEALPAFFGKKKKAKLKNEEQEVVDAFFGELLGGLGRAQKWGAEEQKQFLRDLALYTDFVALQETAARIRKRGKTPEEEAPFIARVALLLDPSMLEQGRHAARKFHAGVGLMARKLLKKTLG